MSRSDPASSLTGAAVGHVCDACNADIGDGDLVQGYARRTFAAGWTLRSLRCTACSHSHLTEASCEADEALVEAVFLKHRLASVRLTDLSPSADGGDP